MAAFAFDGSLCDSLPPPATLPSLIDPIGTQPEWPYCQSTRWGSFRERRKVQKHCNHIFFLDQYIRLGFVVSTLCLDNFKVWWPQLFLLLQNRWLSLFLSLVSARVSLSSTLKCPYLLACTAKLITLYLKRAPTGKLEIGRTLTDWILVDTAIFCYTTFLFFCLLQTVFS